MLLFIISVLGHPAMLLFHALHWSGAWEYPEAMLMETVKGVLPESGRAQMEVILNGTPEWMEWSLDDDTPDVSSRRLTENAATGALYIVQWAIGLAITIGLTYCFANTYRTGITDKRVQWQGTPQGMGLAPTNGEWKYGTFQCFDNCDYCMYGCCCEACRLGDTYTLTNVGPSYITYIHYFVAVQVIGQVIQLVVAIVFGAIGVENAGNAGNLGFFVGNLFLAYWLSGQRVKLRQALGDPSPENHCAMDFVCYWCCICCTAIQEGRQVDEITNTQTKCTFKLLPLQGGAAPPTVVGQPVVGTVVAPPAGNAA
jgi:Cys-rich protein (TIGR01571 family)